MNEDHNNNIDSPEFWHELDRLRTTSRWIAMTEEKPPKDILVLLIDDEGTYWLASRYEQGGEMLSDEGFDYDFIDFTHWMLLPPTPDNSINQALVKEQDDGQERNG